MLDKPIKKSQYDEKYSHTDEYFNDKSTTGRSKFYYFLILITMISVFAGGYYLVKSTNDIMVVDNDPNINNNNLPVIQGINKECRIIAEKEMQSEGEFNKLVYNAIAKTRQKEEVENIMPLPEEPLDVHSHIALTSELEDFADEMGVKLENNTDQLILPYVSQTLDSNMKFIQLGIYRGEKDAKNTWSFVQNKHKDLLKNMKMRLVAKDIGDKGKLYHLQAGPIKDHATAQFICKKLINSKQGCIVVNR